MSDAGERHAQQVAFWNGPGAERWVTQQARMDAALAPVAAAVIAKAAVAPGEVVLDVGCGTGATTLELARTARHVTGLDVSAPMLGLARQRGEGVANVTFVLGDAAAHDFAAAEADLLFSRFGVMFFGDPVSAFANLRRALKPGGRVAFACWRPLNENPWMLLPLQAAQKHAPPLPRPGPEDPGPFAFGDTARVTRILTGAGFQPPAFEAFDLAMDLAQGEGLERAVAQARDFGAAGRLLADQPEDVVAAATAEIRNALAPLVQDGHVRLGGAVWLVTTRA